MAGTVSARISSQPFGNHVDEANFTLRNTCGWRYFRIKKAELVQG